MLVYRKRSWVILHILMRHLNSDGQFVDERLRRTKGLHFFVVIFVFLYGYCIHDITFICE